MIMRDRTTGVPDSKELDHAEYRMWEQFGFLEGDRQPLPPPFPPVTLNLPVPDRFDLDFFSCNSVDFCSARLRAALAQPPDMVQYLPVTVNTPDPRIRAMDYKVIRVLASQPTIDVHRSECKFTVEEDQFVGGPLVSIEFEYQLALLPGLQPRTAVFRADELSTRVFATDGLAERVMQAGCLGIEFRDPECWCLASEPFIRTATGIERRSRATRRSHLRVVKRMRAVPVPPGA